MEGSLLVVLDFALSRADHLGLGALPSKLVALSCIVALTSVGSTDGSGMLETGWSLALFLDVSLPVAFSLTMYERLLSGSLMAKISPA